MSDVVKIFFWVVAIACFLTFSIKIGGVIMAASTSAAIVVGAMSEVYILPSLIGFFGSAIIIGLTEIYDALTLRK